jgi:hypothetical protein
MAAPIPMPACGDRIAPQFDLTHPRELRHYFSNLNFILGHAGVIDNTEMKQHAIRYVDIDTSELWEAMPEYLNHTKTYTEFRIAIYKLYPRSEEERKWSVADMDKLVGEQQRLGVLSLRDLGDYH